MGIWIIVAFGTLGLMFIPITAIRGVMSDREFCERFPQYTTSRDGSHDRDAQWQRDYEEALRVLERIGE